MTFSVRKANRLAGYDYSENGGYFITLCTKDRKNILSRIGVGDGVLDVPQNKLSYYGEIANQVIMDMSGFYDNICVEKYVIMPNHIHMLLLISNDVGGTSRTPSPTPNSTVSSFVSTFKRFCNKKYGHNIFQRSFHDRIIRNESEYRMIWEYIDTNPIKWREDCFYSAEEPAMVPPPRR